MRLYPLPSCFSPRNSQTSNICSAAGMSEPFTDINLFSLHSSPVRKILLGALLTGKLRPRAGKSLARDDTLSSGRWESNSGPLATEFTFF